MSNVEKLKKYLIGDNDDGYLLKEISNGKVIMLSGEWGSGKTHFWHLSDDSIKVKLDEMEKPNIYISLYGKSSLQEIENEVFTKAYYKSKGRDDNKKDVIEKLSATFSKLSSYVDEVSPIKVTPVIDFLETLKKDAQENSAEELMNEGLIIAFDDFERKSTLVNLNDLFGFITNLTIQYKATIVIILNDDVFEGKEREVFTNVKEKTVSKYLKFTPASTELFEIIFNKYALDEKYKTIILDAINEFGLLNARIYENILESFQEYNQKNPGMIQQEIRYFVFTLINFNLNHIVFKFYGYSDSSLENNPNVPTFFTEQKDLFVRLIQAMSHDYFKASDRFKIRIDVLGFLKNYISSDYQSSTGGASKTKPTEKLTEDLKIVDKYSDVIWSYWRLETKLEYRKDVSEESIRKINDFIETGIL